MTWRPRVFVVKEPALADQQLVQVAMKKRRACIPACSTSNWLPHPLLVARVL